LVGERSITSVSDSARIGVREVMNLAEAVRIEPTFDEDFEEGRAAVCLED